MSSKKIIFLINKTMSTLIYKNKVCRSGRSQISEWSMSKLLKDDNIKKWLKEDDIVNPTKELIFDLLKKKLEIDNTEIVINRNDTKVLDKQIAKFGKKKHVKKLAKKHKINYKGVGIDDLRENILSFLDDKYSNEPVIEGHDDWDTVPLEYRFISENYCFDIRYLCHCLAQGLNHSEYGGPKPKWPSNPYTRKPFNREEVLLIRDMIAHNGLGINIALRDFFELFEFLEEDKASSNHIYINSALSGKLRYKHINNFDSQSNFTGHWVDKNTNYSSLEMARQLWLDLGQNLTRAGLRQKERIERMPAESYDISKDNIVYIKNKSEK